MLQVVTLKNIKIYRMKYKDEAPENQGGLGDMLPAEVLKLLNELMEQLHRKDKGHQGSKIQFVYVASGGQHVETQINVKASPPTPLQRARGVDSAEASKSLPDVLATDTAMALWKKVQAAGYVDDSFQPLISRTQSALLADTMAERLGIREKWKTFEALWKRKNMYRDYYKALNLQQSLEFQDRIKKLFR